ncbi:MAG: TonB family protein [Gemmatimonadota bacterium]|nr:TonB family protein [Gemmatimonadota bacterium]
MNRRWRDDHGRVWRWSLLAAAGLHLAALLLSDAASGPIREALIPDSPAAALRATAGSELEVVDARIASPREPVPPGPARADPVPAPTPVIEEVPEPSDRRVGDERREASDLPLEGAGEAAGREPPRRGERGASPPRLLRLVVPDIPDGVDRERARGRIVHLLVRVLADGTVGEVRVELGSRIAGLDAAARSAAHRTRWAPATRDGRRIARWTRTKVRF